MRETRQCVRDLPAAHGGIVRREDDDEVLVHVPGCLAYPMPSPHSALLALSAPRKARLRRRTTANVYAHGAADVVVPPLSARLGPAAGQDRRPVDSALYVGPR